MNLNSYLIFNGNAEEVLSFYQSILGGNLKSMQKFEDLGPEQCEKMSLSEADKQKVMHAILDIKGQLLMFSDAPSGMESRLVAGTNYSVCICPDSKEQGDKFFNDLSEGGSVKMPLRDTFGGAYFGMLTDKYGVHWLIYLPQT